MFKRGGEAFVQKNVGSANVSVGIIVRSVGIREQENYAGNNQAGDHGVETNIELAPIHCSHREGPGIFCLLSLLIFISLFFEIGACCDTFGLGLETLVQPQILIWQFTNGILYQSVNTARIGHIVITRKIFQLRAEFEMIP